MSVMQKSVVQRCCAWFKAALAGKDRHHEKKASFRPALESLEGRDVPSAVAFNPAQMEAGFSYLNQVVQQQALIIQGDMNALVRDAQLGQSGKLGADMQHLQNDLGNGVTAINSAFTAVLNGQIPTSAPPSTAAVAPSSAHAPSDSASTPTHAAPTPSHPPISGKPSPYSAPGGSYNSGSGYTYSGYISPYLLDLITQQGVNDVEGFADPAIPYFGNAFD